MPNQIATATMEGTRKKGRPCKRWQDKVEEDLNVLGIKDRQAMARDRWEWRKVVLEAKVRCGAERLRRRRSCVCCNIAEGYPASVLRVTEFFQLDAEVMQHISCHHLT
jgi:hypothetical protein